MLEIQLASMIKIASIFALFVSIRADREEIGKNFTSATATLPQESQRIHPILKIDRSLDTKSVKIGSTISFTCDVSPSEEGDEVWWTKDGTNLTDAQIIYPNSTATINIKMEDEKDTGSYICEAKTREGILINETIDVTVPPEPGKTTGGHGDRVNSNESAVLSCQLEGYPLRGFEWVKIGDWWNSGEQLKNFANVSQIANHVSMTLSFANASRNNNGTYECSAYDYEDTKIKNRFDLVVAEVPEVWIDFIKAVGVDKVYLNWTVNDWNDPVQKYFVEYNKIGDEDWIPYSDEIEGRNSSYVLKGLENQTDYHFRISASNSVGRSPAYSVTSKWITTLEKDPQFIPEVSILENTVNSITLVWTEPPEDMRDHLFFYEIMVTRWDKIEKYHCPVQSFNIYILLNLDFEVTSYQLNVQACSNYTRLCGGWSPQVRVQTLSENSQSSSTAGLAPAVNLISLYFAVKYVVS